MTCTIDVWRLDLTAMPVLDACDLSPMSDVEFLEIAAFRNAPAARRFAICRLTARQLLGAYGAPGGARVTIVRGPHGKPLCADAGAPWFNVSHTLGRAVIAISSRCEIGIDIEPNASFKDTARLWNQVCSPAECQWLDSHRARADTLFGRLWTRKEAILKALGTGLSMSPVGLDLGGCIEFDEGLVEHESEGATRSSAVRWKTMHEFPGHIGAIAARVRNHSDQLIVTLRDFDGDRLRRDT